MVATLSIFQVLNRSRNQLRNGQALGGERPYYDDAKVSANSAEVNAAVRTHFVAK